MTFQAYLANFAYPPSLPMMRATFATGMPFSAANFAMATPQLSQLTCRTVPSLVAAADPLPLIARFRYSMTSRLLRFFFCTWSGAFSMARERFQRLDRCRITDVRCSRHGGRGCTVGDGVGCRAGDPERHRCPVPLLQRSVSY
ncbi:hypothetical protein ACH4GK_28765 [Streptomyces rimosus]|uniref:hypothetical protein n=1 Tax=Streptomyces rimosus TaxID=1927 RepID=UPI0004C556A4|nr:hypothetical protein [Streptomyces rimosus]